MKDSIKDEYFSKKQELKVIEKKIIIIERQKEDLATKLKESERLGKIARSKIKKIKGMLKAEKWKDDDDDLEKEKDDGKFLDKLNKEGRGWKREDMYAWKEEEKKWKEDPDPKIKRFALPPRPKAEATPDPKAGKSPVQNRGKVLEISNKLFRKDTIKTMKAKKSEKLLALKEAEKAEEEDEKKEPTGDGAEADKK
jgi:hypothetical protein